MSTLKQRLLHQLDRVADRTVATRLVPLEARVDDLDHRVTDVAGLVDGVATRLDALTDRIDELNHLLRTVDAGVQDNRGQILESRHDAHVLLVTGLDAANEATALLGRSLADLRSLVEERLDEVSAEVRELGTGTAPAGADRPRRSGRR